MIDSEKPGLELRRQAGHFLTAYKNSEISLKDLIDKLDDFWSKLGESSWEEEFRGHWWTLEQVYSVALDRNELDSLPSDATSDINEALVGLEGLLGIL